MKVGDLEHNYKVIFNIAGFYAIKYLETEDLDIIRNTCIENAFNWDKTVEGSNIWCNISNNNFNSFFKFYANLGANNFYDIMAKNRELYNEKFGKKSTKSGIKSNITIGYFKTHIVVYNAIHKYIAQQRNQDIDKIKGSYDDITLSNAFDFFKTEENEFVWRRVSFGFVDDFFEFHKRRAEERYEKAKNNLSKPIKWYLSKGYAAIYYSAMDYADAYINGDYNFYNTGQLSSLAIEDAFPITKTKEGSAVWFNVFKGIHRPYDDFHRQQQREGIWKERYGTGVKPTSIHTSNQTSIHDLLFKDHVYLDTKPSYTSNIMPLPDFDEEIKPMNPVKDVKFLLLELEDEPYLFSNVHKIRPISTDFLIEE